MEGVNLRLPPLPSCSPLPRQSQAGGWAVSLVQGRAWVPQGTSGLTLTHWGPAGMACQPRCRAAHIPGAPSPSLGGWWWGQGPPAWVRRPGPPAWWGVVGGVPESRRLSSRLSHCPPSAPLNGPLGCRRWPPSSPQGKWLGRAPCTPSPWQPLGAPPKALLGVSLKRLGNGA